MLIFYLPPILEICHKNSKIFEQSYLHLNDNSVVSNWELRGQLSTKHTPFSMLARFINPYWAFLTFQKISPYNHEWTTPNMQRDVWIGDPLQPISYSFIPWRWPPTARLFPQPTFLWPPRTSCGNSDSPTESPTSFREKRPPPPGC